MLRCVNEGLSTDVIEQQHNLRYYLTQHLKYFRGPTVVGYIQAWVIEELQPRAKRARGRSPIAKEMW